MRWLPRLISWIVIAAVIAGGFLLVRSAMPTTKAGQRFETYALFRDGSRIAVSSPVMIAGVRVGDVTTMSVEGGFARIDMVLRDDTNIPIDSWVTKRADSPFGDSYIEIIPTGGDEGAPVARRLKSGERLEHVIEGSSTDAVLRAVARTMPKIDNGLDTVHDFALSARKWTDGTAQDALVGAERWLIAGHIDRPIESADRAMTRAENGTTRAAEAVADAKPDVARTITRIDRGIASARTQMADLKSGLHDALDGARTGIDKIDPTVDKMSEVVTAINEGSGADWKGTLGRLVNSPELADTIEDVTDAVREASGGLDRFKSYLGVRVEYNVFSAVPKLYVTGELYARDDKFYRVELVKSQLGGLPADQLTDTPGTPVYDRYTEMHDSLRFTAQFGKVLAGRYRLRGGIKESTFGIGADALLGDRLMLSSDLFGAFDRTPELKLSATLAVYRTLSVTAGVDDVLNRPGYLPILNDGQAVPNRFKEVRYGRDYFVGTSLTFTDADLALMLRVYGAMIVGLLL